MNAKQRPKIGDFVKFPKREESKYGYIEDIIDDEEYYVAMWEGDELIAEFESINSFVVLTPAEVLRELERAK